MSYLSQTDPDIADFLNAELTRQQDVLELIPSENIVSRAVLEALGSVATNKYSEGYPGKRYYGGNQEIDKIESLAIERAKQLFGAEHVNVQALSGAPANIAVYFALLKAGDTVLGMDLSHGGHLTHGHPVTAMAKIFNFVRYKTDESGAVDMDHLRSMTLEHKPKIVLAGFSAYSRQLDYEAFKRIADEVGAITMMDMAHIAGLIAGKQLPNPVPIFDIVTTTTHKTLRGPRGGMILCKEKFAKAIDKSIFPGLQGGPHENVIAAKAVAFREALEPEFAQYAKQIIVNAQIMCDELQKNGFHIMFGGTQNHLMLVDVFSSKGVTGHTAETILDNAGITLNKNMIPNDPRPPLDPSGIRLGTPAITTRGMKEDEMRWIAQAITKVLSAPEDASLHLSIREEVKNLARKYPIYPELTYA
ncbi:serine hydroxymethyltransferase [Candidatus Uhrbacteria bacterium]|nr:serine hydroxymethyltransferase [Candidatus Uhrbacteria bacterium]